jgi:Tfp pilus assembly protein PilF
MRLRRRASGLLLMLGVVAGSGCTGLLHLPKPPVTSDSVVEALRQRDLAWEHPFALEPLAQEQVRVHLGMHGSQEERLQRAVRYLNDPSGLHFQYAASTTLTAREALRSPRGDCMTYAALLYAVAHTLRVPVGFVYARQSPLYSEEDDAFVASSHIAIVHGSGPNALVVDLASWLAGWKHVQYEPMGAHKAAALFFNNRAVEALRRGRAQQARTLLELVVEQVPDLPELQANLSALLLREGRVGEARERVEAALQRFPEHSTLWLHALRAAQLGGDTARAQELLAGAERVALRDPAFHLLRAREAWQAQDYAKADSHLHKALVVVPDSALLLAWRVRVALARQHTEQGLELYSRLRRDFPQSNWVHELPRLHPELGALASIPQPPGPGLSRRTKVQVTQ